MCACQPAVHKTTLTLHSEVDHASVSLACTLAFAAVGWLGHLNTGGGSARQWWRTSKFTVFSTISIVVTEKGCPGVSSVATAGLVASMRLLLAIAGCQNVFRKAR